MTSQSLDEKIAFFNALDALDNVSDGDDDVDDKEQEHRNKCRAYFASKKKTSPVRDTAPIRPRRTASMPTPFATTPGPRVIEATPGARNPAVSKATGPDRLGTGTASFIEESPVPDSARPPPASLRRSTTLPLPAPSSGFDQSPSTNTAMRKRKRQPSTKAVPEAAQIFRGLAFCYIPDNDIAPARKLRIGRAQDYGAKRVRDLQSASHAIVDKNLTYKDIENILGPTPPESLVIVNEEYPIECISFRTLLNPDQNRYRVPGCPALTQKPASNQVFPAASQTSDRSLRVKEPRKSRRRDSSPAGISPQSEQPSLQGDTGNVLEESGDKSLGGASQSSPAPDAKPHPSSPSRQEDNPTDIGDTPPPRRSSTRDELSEYIELMQQFKDLPLDAEEDDFQSVKDAQEPISDSETGEHSEDERARKRPANGARRSGKKDIAFEDRFACNRGGTKDKLADSENPNAKTIEVLQSMCDYYTRINDHWRTIAYRKAIATLRRQTVKITTEEEAYRLPNIGRRLAAKIEEIVHTNTLRRLQYANGEPLDKVLETFLKIYDVGTSRANKWIAQGFRTLDDLRHKADLTPNQRIGIEHHDDLNTRIPRAEVTQLFEYVRREAARLDPAAELLVGGSYRRGSDSSGDIDIIVTRRGTTGAAELVPFLEELVAALTRKGFLVATLAALHAHRPGKNGPGKKWHGCCVLPRDGRDGNRDEDGNGNDKDKDKDAPPRQVWRRIDFLLVPESEYGAALIYFTGNDIFNRSMRLLASKKGMRLNQRGLYKEVTRGKGRVKVTEGELVEGRDERRIFELLGVKWREPWERWC
ncbi:hypothetical protein VTK56DRAFT_7998 [Thermocarpiscus australiensis]